jgi:plastocyanin
MRMLHGMIGLIFLTGVLQAENITGSILIKRRLTRRSVTAEIPLYQRGPGLELGKDRENDPIAYERAQVVVWIEGSGPGGAVARPEHAMEKPERPLEKMEQIGRRFVPDLVVIAAGGTVSFPNGDPIFHNVFSLSKPKIFDLGNYVKGETRNVTFTKPGVVYVNCHLHPNMAAAVVVAPNRWYARSDREGHFTLRDLPPGSYTMVAWHKSAGSFRKTVEVAAGADTPVEFFIPLGEPTGIP